MCSIIVILGALLAGLFGLGVSSTAQVATVEAPTVIEAPQVISCAAAVSAGTDIDNLLALVGDTFSAENWTQQLQTLDTKTIATWLSNDPSAVAYLEYLHYDCGVSDEQLKLFYNEAGIATLLANYDSYEAIDACREGETHLLEFSAVNDGYDYSVLYWVKPLTPTRAVTLMLVMPQDNPALLAETAAQLFPELPTCAAAAA